MGSQTIMEQYLIIYLTEVTIKEFKSKYSRIHSCEQNLAILILRRQFSYVVKDMINTT